MFTGELGIGAGPNLIRRDALSTRLICAIRKFHTSLRSAGDSTFVADGVIRRWANLGGHVTPTLARVSPTQEITVTLATTSMENPIGRIELAQQPLILIKESNVSILASFSKKTIATTVLEDTNRPDESVRRVVKFYTIPPYSDLFQVLTTSKAGVYVLQA